MSKLTRASLFLTFALCPLPFALLAAQVPPPPPVPPPAPQGQRDTPLKPVYGNAVIAGALLSDDGANRPVRRAVVTVNAPELRGERRTTTDDQGHFAFTDLPAGRFNLSATKPGYVMSYYGSKRPGRQPFNGQPIVLADGQRVTDVALKMLHGSVITGMVTNQLGQPQQNVQVQVMQFRAQNGQRVLGPAQVSNGSPSSGQTDDRGIYRIYGLAPGEYVVGAILRNLGAGDVHLISSSDIQDALQAIRQAPAQPTGTPGAAPASTPPPGGGSSFDDGQTVGYAPVYFPGTNDAGGATPVTLGANEERGGIDFGLQLVSTSRVEGSVVTPDGQVAQNVQMNVSAKNGIVVNGMMSANQIRQQDGKFTVLGLPPGEYTISARFQDNSARLAALGVAPAAAPARAGGPPTPPPQPTTLWALADVSVNGQNVTGIVLSLQPGMHVSGRLAFDGATPPADLTRARVSIQVMQNLPGLSSNVPAATVNADGTFTLSGVVPGKYRLSANVPGVRGGGPGPLAALPAGAAPPAGVRAGAPGGVANAPTAPPATPPVSWSLRTAVVAGRDSQDFPFEVRPNEDVADAVLTFTDKTTELSGMLQNASGGPASGYEVVVFSADKSFWLPQGRRIRTPIKPGADGTFRLTGLPAGEYFLAAATDLDPQDMQDPSILEQLAAAAIRVTLSEGTKTVQNIRIAGGF